MIAGKPADPNAICHMTQPGLPDFRFEWHPGKKIVYVINDAMGRRTGRVTANGIGWNVQTEGDANNAVLLWCRGYRACLLGMSHNESGKLSIFGVD